MENASAEPALKLTIGSPVLILTGPSPASNELAQSLRGLDVKVLTAASPADALARVAEEDVHLVLVDARASRRIIDLHHTVERLRETQADMAGLFWFDSDAPDDEILDLCTPADDHMAAHIGVDESLRRLHLLTGRVPKPTSGEHLVVGDLELDTTHRTVTRAGVDIDLSDTEFRLLRLLMRHARTVLPKSEILQEVWEYDFAGQANIVELYVSYLRKKIEAGMPRMIHTVRGAGYVLRPAPGTGSASSGEEATP